MDADWRGWIVKLATDYRAKNHLAAGTPLTLMWDAPGAGSVSQADIDGLAGEHYVTLEPVVRTSEDVARDTATSYLYVTDTLIREPE